MSEETARRVAAHPGAPVGSADREVDRSRRHGAQTRRSDVVDGGAGAIAKEDAAASGGATVLVERSEVTVQVASSALSEAMIDCQGDAPACDVCGTITVRNGACYKCLNCGHSMGCS